MRRLRTWVLCGATALVAAIGPNAIADPASATLITSWDFDQRPEGMPATGDAARTIASAAGAVTVGPGGDVAVRVDLDDVPDESTAAVVHLAFGTPDESGSCVTAWETSLPTWEPGESGEPTATVQLAGTFEPGGASWSCGEVSTTSPDGSQVYDRMQGRITGGVVADPGGTVRITHVTGTRVRPHRWQTLHLRVRYSGSPIEALDVRGSGRDVHVRKARFDTPLDEQGRASLAVRVRLDASQRRRVLLQVRPYGYLAFAGDDRRQVWLRPVRH
jgi:hypothetical protein